MLRARARICYAYGAAISGLLGLWTGLLDDHAAGPWPEANNAEPGQHGTVASS